jgi:LysM repeat protein
MEQIAHWPGICSTAGHMAQSFDQLKQKYQAAITMAKNSGHLQNVNMEGDKLFIRAEVANNDIKNSIWNEIKRADAQYGDLNADITVNSSLPQPAAASATQTQRTYTVEPGDTLSKIAQKFYGKATEYNKIFEANKDKLPDADHVKAGQELVIPA